MRWLASVLVSFVLRTTVTLCFLVITVVAVPFVAGRVRLWKECWELVKLHWRTPVQEWPDL